MGVGFGPGGKRPAIWVHCFGLRASARVRQNCIVREAGA